MERKLEDLDFWIKKMEKSLSVVDRKLQPALYNDILRYVETAIQYDFNLIIEEFGFYNELPLRIQTELIQNVAMFKEFERAFGHFFDECERGFINEVIVNLFVRTERPGKVLIPYYQKVEEISFIRQGVVEVYNNINDSVVEGRPVLYLPKYAYYGEF